MDIAVGEGQSLGNRLDFGGPSFGFFAATEEHLRRMPGRIAGETTDVDGRRGFVLALQTREQHIRREKATHNICTSQALNALAGTIYLAWLGARASSSSASCSSAGRPTRASGSPRWTESSCSTRRRGAEFAVRLDAPVAEVVDRVSEEGIAAGYPLGRDYPEYEDGLLVAITERSRDDIDRLADALAKRFRRRLRPLSRGETNPRSSRRPRDDARIDRLAARDAATPTPQQREAAVTIYERSVEAGARPFSLPPTRTASTRPRSPS